MRVASFFRSMRLLSEQNVQLLNIHIKVIYYGRSDYFHRRWWMLRWQWLLLKQEKAGTVPPFIYTIILYMRYALIMSTFYLQQLGSRSTQTTIFPYASVLMINDSCNFSFNICRARCTRDLTPEYETPRRLAISICDSSSSSAI
jgi:hypothetical protein